MTILQKVLRDILVAIIRFYQVAHLPFWQGSCRFHPTCSHYAIESLQLHGPLRGSYMAARRVLRCHPFHPGGFDPVPPSENSKP